MVRKRKNLKPVYSFDVTISNWQVRLALACDLIFKKIAEEYVGKKKNHEQQYI